MDKRYFLIIGIIVVCCTNMYIISTFSDVVGDASFDVGNYTFTLPPGFSIENTQNNRIIIVNQNNNMKIDIFSHLSKTDNYENAHKFITTNNECRLLSNGTIHHNNIPIDSLYYVQNGHNSSVFFFNKENNNFKVIITNFNHATQHNDTINIITQLAGSARVNPRV